VFACFCLCFCLCLLVCFCLRFCLCLFAVAFVFACVCLTFCLCCCLRWPFFRLFLLVFPHVVACEWPLFPLVFACIYLLLLMVFACFSLRFCSCLLIFACFCICFCSCLLASAYVFACVCLLLPLFLLVFSCFCLHFGVDVAGPGFALLVVVAFACGLSVVGVAGVINDVGWLLLASFESIIFWKSKSKIRNILPLLLLCLHL